MHKAIIAITLVMFSSPAFAFNMRTATLPTNSHTLYLNPWVQLLMPDHYAILQQAADIVDGNASQMRFTMANDDDTSISTGNGESEIDFTSDAVALCGRTGCTHVLTDGAGSIVETDVFFDVDADWLLNDTKTLSMAYDPNGTRPLLNVAVHEFLHALGAEHESDVYNIMGVEWNVVSTNGEHTETMVSEDTTQGLISVYGARGGVTSTIEDLSVTHWKWLMAGAAGYSRHTRCLLHTSTGGALTLLSTADEEPEYQVSAGQTIEVEQTVENHGTTFHTVDVKWYVSENDYISKYDTLIASSSLDKATNGPFTWTRTVTLPSNLVSGTTYWIGVVVDPDDVLGERNEVNNATYIAAVTVE